MPSAAFLLECGVIMLTSAFYIAMLSVFMLSVFMLSVFVLSVFMLSVFMLNDMATARYHKSHYSLFMLNIL